MFGAEVDGNIGGQNGILTAGTDQDVIDKVEVEKVHAVGRWRVR